MLLPALAVDLGCLYAVLQLFGLLLRAIRAWVVHITETTGQQSARGKDYRHSEDSKSYEKSRHGTLAPRDPIPLIHWELPIRALP